MTTATIPLDVTKVNMLKRVKLERKIKMTHQNLTSREI